MRLSTSTNIRSTVTLAAFTLLASLAAAEICIRDADCHLEPFHVCTNMTCQHKTVLPMLPIEVWGLLVLGLLLGFANIGGIGGGGLIIPLSMAMFGFTTKNAVAISNSTIFCGAIVRFFMFSIWQRHPTKTDATLIDYSVASVMIPAVLIGSYVGILVNVMMPDTVLQIVLTLLLVYMTYESFKKAVTKYKAENQKILEEKKDSLLQ